MEVLRFFLLIYLVIYSSIASGQLYINEFVASNSSEYVDPDFGDDSDWVEIYNSGSSSINLKGYYLTDNLGKPDKWQISSDLEIGPGNYAVIWADDRDQGIHTSFKLSLEGEEIGLFDPDLNQLDSIVYPHQRANVSMGRSVDLTEWLYFESPTPEAANTTQGYPDFTKNKPHFSVLGKMFADPFTLVITADTGKEIRYTLDGSEPSSESAVYLDPMQITNTSIVRARVFNDGMLPGPVVTHSYFYDDHFTDRQLPIISIAANPDDFWDADQGIYVQDFKPDWEIAVNVELFENNGSDRAGFNEGAGIKVNGLYSWQLPQKMLGVYFRGRYGSGSLDYPLFYDRNRSSFESFALRASGSDWSYTLFRDILGQAITEGNMNIEHQGERPSIVYVNGQYMGIHNIRSKVDGDFIIGNFGLESGTFDMVENEDYAEAGDLEAYQQLVALYSKDLSVQANYDAVAQVMDIENFTDYVIAELYVRNTSIGHNVMAWKPKDGGKWRWILMDLDRGFFSPHSNLIEYFEGQSIWPFEQLLDNDGYRQYFIDRVVYHMNTTFNAQRVHKLIDFYADRIRQELPYHIDRWQGTTSDYGDALPSLEYWENEVNELKIFASQRPGYILNDLMNYGVDDLVQLAISKEGDVGNRLLVNDLLLEEELNSTFPVNSTVSLTALPGPGERFVGWKSLQNTSMISKDSEWKYLDNGSDQGTAWRSLSYDDSDWNSGLAELGYGDNDEATEVGFGPNSGSKYITTYFRKTINLDAAEAKGVSYTLSLLYDDGAVAYVNGMEVARVNMPSDAINFETEALSAKGGDSEEAYVALDIDPNVFAEGENVIAVEIHQASSSSSDISFNLELSGLLSNSDAYLSTDEQVDVEMTEQKGVIAVFESVEECILEAEIGADLLLSKDCSPYFVPENVVVSENAVLTIEPGVELAIADGVSITVHGQMIAEGTESEPIVLASGENEFNQEWGALIFQNSDQTSSLKWVEIRDATNGYERNILPAAISAFNADLNMDHMTITDVNGNPIAARYSAVQLSNSLLHSKITGDLINVKYGEATITNCEFIGNEQPDTDAIDLDDVENGVVRNCKISNLLGSNSDGIDIGEEAQNIHIDSVIVYRITDKGLSVGQRSSVLLTNSIFLNCNMGVGIKDSSYITIDKCTFYGNYYSVASYEKNLGDAGGNVLITNSILSNSVETSVLSDIHSKSTANYSLSDTDELPAGNSNLLTSPSFNDPTHFDFTLKAESSAKSAGQSNGNSIDLGAPYTLDHQPQAMIAGIFVNDDNLQLPEFLKIYNPGNETLDLSGYEITRGITNVFSSGLMLAANDTLYLTENANDEYWDNTEKNVIQWESGKLSNDGESIQLEDASGIIIDHIRYDQETWPSIAGNTNIKWELKNESLDNHLPESWEVIPMVDAELIITGVQLKVNLYPNPTTNHLVIDTNQDEPAVILDLNGREIMRFTLQANQVTRLDVSGLNSGIYVIRLLDTNQVFRFIKK